jgi:hypothetical protein
LDRSEKILFSVLCAGWLIPLVIAWPRRFVSPLWAWVRIVSAVGIFCVLELLIWRPQTPYLKYAAYVFGAVYISRYFILRTGSSEASR